MTLLIDPPNAPGHGRMWSHLASDTSYDELHAFALALGVPGAWVRWRSLRHSSRMAREGAGCRSRPGHVSRTHRQAHRRPDCGCGSHRGCDRANQGGLLLRPPVGRRRRHRGGRFAGRACGSRSTRCRDGRARELGFVGREVERRAAGGVPVVGRFGRRPGRSLHGRLDVTRVRRGLVCARWFRISTDSRPARLAVAGVGATQVARRLLRHHRAAPSSRGPAWGWSLCTDRASPVLTIAESAEWVRDLLMGVEPCADVGPVRGSRSGRRAVGRWQPDHACVVAGDFTDPFGDRLDRRASRMSANGPTVLTVR